MDDIRRQLEKLQAEVQALKNQRVTQGSFLPDVIKMRHIGEGVRYIQTGVVADKPATPATPSDSCMMYYAYDENKLYVWDIGSSTWLSTTLS